MDKVFAQCEEKIADVLKIDLTSFQKLMKSMGFCHVKFGGYREIMREKPDIMLKCIATSAQSARWLTQADSLYS